MSAISGLTVLPVAPWPLLVALVAVAAGLIWWPAGPQERSESMTARVRRSGLVLLLLAAALRPAIPGTDVRVDASAVDVYVVVDTTSSAMARDYADGRPRLEGVRADVKGIATQLSGARFSLTTFDIEATTRLPLTSDSAAIGAAADTLRAETTVWSRGSSITLARDLLRSTLERGRESHPERARLVFYLGDGEQTSSQQPAPFAVDDQLVNGGAVLGYGTSAGGRMASTGVRDTSDIVDPSTGQPAVSVIDELQLNTIASQLGLPYLHRTSDDGGAAIVDAVRLKELAPLREVNAGEVVGGRTELGWVALLLLAALAAWELGALLAAATAVGRPARRRPAMVAAMRGRPGTGARRPGLAPLLAPLLARTKGTTRRAAAEPTSTGGRR